MKRLVVNHAESILNTHSETVKDQMAMDLLAYGISFEMMEFEDVGNGLNISFKRIDPMDIYNHLDKNCLRELKNE